MTSEELERFSLLYGVPQEEIEELTEEFRKERGREPKTFGDLLEVLE